MGSEAHYVDSSAILRALYRIGGGFPLGDRGSVLTSSELVRVEVALSIERRRLSGEIDSAQVEQLRRDSHRLLGSIHLFPVSDDVLSHASQPFPITVSLRTALHVATAQLVRLEVAALTFWTWSEPDAAAAMTRQLQVAGLTPRA